MDIPTWDFLPSAVSNWMSSAVPGFTGKAGRQKGQHNLLGQFRADDAGTDDEDIHVVVLDALVGGIGVVRERGADLRHLVGKGGFAMNYFVMGNGQDKIFMKGVEHAKGHLVMMKATVDGVFPNVTQCIVHPSQMPWQAETQASKVGRLVVHRP